jgi:hypothetical protein
MTNPDAGGGDLFCPERKHRLPRVVPAEHDLIGADNDGPELAADPQRILQRLEVTAARVA